MNLVVTAELINHKRENLFFFPSWLMYLDSEVKQALNRDIA
jgi:hypothetical protein